MRQLKSIFILLALAVPFVANAEQSSGGSTPRPPIKKKSVALAVCLFVSLFSTFICHAEGRWNVYAGGSVSHLCEKAWYGNDKLIYGWGGGAFIGGGYEFRFTPHWSLSPQLDFAYYDNGAYLDNKELSFYGNHVDWHDFLTLNIPVIANFRFSLTQTIGLRFGAGPYLQEALYGRRYKVHTDVKENMSGNFAHRFNVGIIGEAAVETGNHFSYMLRVQYPFLKEGWIKNTIILSAGIMYSF